MSAALVLAGVFAVHVAAILSPGPNLLLVGRAAIGASRRAGVAAALGIAAGAAAWSAAALLGLEVVRANAAGIAAALQVAGAAYLAYLAVRLWRGAGRGFAWRAEPWRPGAAAAFGAGLATNLTNPKALVFYLGVVAALVPAAAPSWLKWAAMATIAANSVVWHVGFAIALSTAPARAFYARWSRGIDRGAAIVLAGVALALVLAG